MGYVTSGLPVKVIS